MIVGQRRSGSNSAISTDLKGGYMTLKEALIRLTISGGILVIAAIVGPF